MMLNDAMKEEILRAFCDPDRWDNMKIEHIADIYELPKVLVREIVESDARIAVEEGRKWRFVLGIMKEVFGEDGIAKKFGISRERVRQIMEEEKMK